MNPAPRISLVIPAFNEEQFLAQLLDSVDEARKLYNSEPRGVEVIVADNAPTDRTAEIARARGCLVARVEKRAIAAARNGGAQRATGEILAFVDADSLLHPETFNAIERTLASGRVIAGATGVRLSRMSTPLWLMLFVAIPLIRLAGLDSGVIFCRRTDWETIGGYNEELLVGEDIQFLLDLKRLGRARGQGFARARGAETITSTRKFDRHGDWRFLIKTLLSPLLWLVWPAAFERWARRYWYEDRP